MQDDKVSKGKERIISFIRFRGPSLPVHISREIDVSLLFASAYLSELKDDDKLKVSSLRVGNSPLYFLPGQEAMLENFINHLNQREREAFTLLKKEGVLEDSKLEPVIRVALRAIKDFAIGLNLRINEETRLIWKYFSLTDEDVENLVRKKILGISIAETKEEKKEEIPVEKKGIAEPEKIEKQEPEKEEKKEAKEKKRKPREKREKKEKKIPDVKPDVKPFKKVVATGKSEFAEKVKDYLLGKDIELIQTFSEKKKEFEGKIRVDTLFGKQEYYLIAKDKKSITESDLSMAVQKAQETKSLAIIMAKGEISKKGKEKFENWKNLIKFEKLRF